MPTDEKDIRDFHEYDANNWQDIKKEATEDMKFVGGDPWTTDDKSQREKRPTIAPEEMGQYFNQVINALRANPRGAKFTPQGNGANDKTAQFYQNKWREVEYRSHGQNAYITAAENAIQRSYGFVRVNTRYANPRSANQDIWLEPLPNPDMVLPDTDAIRPDGSDSTRCFVYRWMGQAEFKKKYPSAKIQNFTEFQAQAKNWIKGTRIMVSEFWQIETTPRQLVLLEVPSGQPTAPGRQIQVFEDEVQDYTARGARVVRQLRKVDYPKVSMKLTNGVEVLSTHDWPGKYIPIVSCFGKVLYTEGDEGMKRTILSMTRFGRDPWKAYCYACSQELEILAMVPKAPVHVWAGQLRGFEKDWQEAPHMPKAYLQSHPRDEQGDPYPSPPGRIDYTQAQHLEAIEVVKEGFRRAIQASMGSNFLPTMGQKRNEKSGIALEKIEQAATQGTYHFVNSYEDMIRHCAVIGEDLMDKIHDYAGDVDTIEADGASTPVRINDPQNEKSISTKGDHVVTISTAPSSESEREAAETFTDTLVSNMQMVAAVAGQKAAAAVLARAIRMRNLGPMGDQLADLIEPPEFKKKPDGTPPNPEVMALQGQVQQLTGLLQQASQEKNAKVVEQQGKFAIAKMQEDADTDRQKLKLDVESHVKVYVAELGAKVERLSTLAEANALIVQHLHEAIQSFEDRQHQAAMATQSHQQALEQADRGVAGQLAVQAAQPQPANGDGASA